tara:strand:- start:670 stop:846 length:177 start_codon:yes stop_codon:yes gene_type:complete
MHTSDDVEYLLRRAQQEARKAKEALARGDNMLMVYAHRELATCYQATAASLMRENTLH